MNVMRSCLVVLAAALAFGSAAYAGTDRAIVSGEQDHSLAASTTVSYEDSFNNAFTLQPQMLSLRLGGSSPRLKLATGSGSIHNSSVKS